jgi:hypothetical protein
MIRRALRAQGLLRHAERHSMAAASNKPRVVQHNPKLGAHRHANSPKSFRACLVINSTRWEALPKSSRIVMFLLAQIDV